MKIEHPNLNISFEIENTRFYTLSLSHFLFETSLPDHSHGSNCYEIHYIISGYGKVKIADTYYDLKPNTFYVNGPHVTHSHVPFREDPMCEYCIRLKLDSPKTSSASKINDSIISIFKERSFWIGEDNQNILGIMQQLFFELDNQYLGYEENMKALLNMLIISTVRNLTGVQKAEAPLIHSAAVDIKSLIIDDYFLYEYKTVSLEGLAERLGLSPRQTERYLKEHYGKTFIQKKTESKMSTAALLLSDSRNNITYISEELGYSSIEHFSTAFKRYYGCSPSEYRKTLRASQ